MIRLSSSSTPLIQHSPRNYGTFINDDNLARLEAKIYASFAKMETILKRKTESQQGASTSVGNSNTLKSKVEVTN